MREGCSVDKSGKICYNIAMRRIFFTVTALLLIVSILGGCTANKFNYVSGNAEINPFGCFDSYGGKVESVEVTASGEFRMRVLFGDNHDYIENAVRAANVDSGAVSSSRYSAGDRVLSLERIEKSYAVVYARSIAALKTSSVRFMTVERYLKEYGNAREFAAEDGGTVNVSLIDGGKSVLVMSGMRNIPIKIDGRIIAATTFGNVSFSGGEVAYSSEECAVIFEPSYTVMIICIAAAVLILLAVVFMLLIKFRVFTNIKLKNAKK